MYISVVRVQVQHVPSAIPHVASVSGGIVCSSIILQIDATKQTIFKIQICATFLFFTFLFLHVNTRGTNAAIQFTSALLQQTHKTYVAKSGMSLTFILPCKNYQDTVLKARKQVNLGAKLNKNISDSIKEHLHSP
jgi:hypothetical protein